MKKTRNAHKKNNRRQKRRTRVNRARKIQDVGRGRLGKLITAAALASAAAEPHHQVVRHRLLASPLGLQVPVPIPVEVPVLEDRATFGSHLASSPFARTLGKKIGGLTTVYVAAKARDVLNNVLMEGPDWRDSAVDRGNMIYDPVNGFYL